MQRMLGSALLCFENRRCFVSDPCLFPAEFIYTSRLSKSRKCSIGNSNLLTQWELIHGSQRHDTGKVKALKVFSFFRGICKFRKIDLAKGKRRFGPGIVMSFKILNKFQKKIMVKDVW